MDFGTVPVTSAAIIAALSGAGNFTYGVKTSIGPTPYTTTVDFEIRDVNGDLYTEIRLAGATNPTANFLAAYTVNSVGFIEQWTQTGGSSIDISPKPTDGTSTALVAINRGTSTTGNSGLEIYQGNASGSLNTYLSGKPAVNSYIAALSGNGKLGVGTASPLTTLHVENDKGSTSKELLRLTDSVGGTALGYSSGYNDGGTTEAYNGWNRYSANNRSATWNGFGSDFSTGRVFGLYKSGEIINIKGTDGADAPGAGFVRLVWIAGTNPGTAKLLAYAGTSNTPSTIVDNVGGGF